MKGRGYKKSWRERIVEMWQALIWKIKGYFLDKKLANPESPVRDEAQEAVAKVVVETDIAPDCVSALVYRGGCAIKVKHDDAWEMFIHNSYMEAADKAIEWLRTQGDEVQTRRVSEMNRKQRRAFDKKRKNKRRKPRRKTG